MVIISKGGPAIKARTVKPKPEGSRWNAEAIMEIKATLRKPNPTDEEQEDPKVERDTKGTGYERQGGADLPDPQTKEDGRSGPRDFRIGKGLIDTYGPTENCMGCEWWLTKEGWRRPHSDVCRDRFEKLLKEDDAGKELRRGRNSRKRKRK